jgi:hypothetical protein
MTSQKDKMTEQTITKDQVIAALQTLGQAPSSRHSYALQRDYLLCLRNKSRGKDKEIIDNVYYEFLVDNREFEEMGVLAREGCLEQIIDLLRRKNPEHVCWRETRIAELYERLGMKEEARAAYTMAAEQTELSSESAIELWKKAGEDNKSKQAEREVARAKLIKIAEADKDERFISDDRIHYLREELGKLREYFFEQGLREEARRTIDTIFEIRAKGSEHYRSDYTRERAAWLKKLGDVKEAQDMCSSFAKEAESDLKILVRGWNNYGNKAFDRDREYCSTSIKYGNHISSPLHIAASFYARAGDDKKAKQLLLEYKNWVTTALHADEFEELYERYGLIDEFIEIAHKMGDFKISAKFAAKHNQKKSRTSKLFAEAAKKATEKGEYREAVKLWRKAGDENALRKAYIRYAESLNPSWDSPREHAHCARVYALAGDFARAAEVIRAGMRGNWCGGEVLNLDKCGGPYYGVDCYRGARIYLPEEARYREKSGQISEAIKIYEALGDSTNFLRLKTARQQGDKK